MKALLAALAVVALFVSGCPSAYQKTYDEETARLEAQQRLRDQQEAARREADRQEALKYVAIPLFAVGSDELDDAAFREIGFQYVALDLRGFRSGSLNEVIAFGKRQG